MIFSSLTFLIFFAVVFVLYWVIGRRRPQNVLLLLASYLFYGWWDWRFALLMLIASLVDFGVAQAIARSEAIGWRRAWLAVTLTCNLGLLGTFKYFNFFAGSFAEAARTLGWNPGDSTLNVILPVGISFYTFQTLSYSIDVYRRQLTPTRDVIAYLAFVSFFPQLVAGPIERAVDLLPQFDRDRKFDADIAADGLRQMLWGLFKKLAVADRLALIVDPVYDRPEEQTGLMLALATFCFAFQIYCDFSGYSDIAIGCAKQFGIRLNRNFAYPYFSQSPQEFWRRWHISLSSWFRDYVYIPLGGSRGSRWLKNRNLLATFLVSGLWHGAAWTYVVWGGLHGLLVALPVATGKSGRSETPGGERLIPAPMTLLKMAATFTAVCFCWVFFRAESWADSMLVLQRMGAGFFAPDPSFAADALNQLQTYLAVTPGARTTLIVLAAALAIEWLGRRSEYPLAQLPAPQVVRWGLYSAALWATVLLIPEKAGAEFIYFDF